MPQPSEFPRQNRPPQGDPAALGMQARLRDQLPVITRLVLLETDPAQERQIATAFYRAGPPEQLKAAVSAALLQSLSPAVRLQAAEALAGIDQSRAVTLPLVFAAYFNERDDETRLAMRNLIQKADLGLFWQLSGYTDTFRYSLQAKTADLKPYDDEKGMHPDQIRRAQVLLHLDPDPEVRRMAASSLYWSVSKMPDAERHGLLAGVIHGLRDPQPHYEGVKSDLVYLAEKVWGYTGVDEQRLPFLPILRRLFASPEQRVAADAAVVSLSLKPDTKEPLEVLVSCLRDPKLLATKIERPEMSVQEIHDIEREIETMRRFIESLIGPDADTSAFDWLQRRYQRGQEKILQKFEELLERQYDAIERRQKHLDDWGREILVSRIASRLDSLRPEHRGFLVDALFGVIEAESEPMRVRKAIIYNLSYNREDNPQFLAKFLHVTADASFPAELRAWACRGIPRLEKLSSSEMGHAIRSLKAIARVNEDPLVDNEIALSERKLRIFQAKPNLRYAMLFDSSGNLRPDAKEIIRDMIKSDYDA